MSTNQEEPTLHELLSRPTGRSALGAAKVADARCWRKAWGVAVASVGAGALLEQSNGTALASSIPKPGVFASSTTGTPAVSATGTNGADGVDTSTDSGVGVSAKSSSNTGVSATSGSGTALVATSSTGLAAHFVSGNVNMDNNLTVTGALSTGTLSSGAGTLASSVNGTPAVKATGTNGADGVDASSDSGIGVSVTSGSGDGVHGMSSGSGVGIFAQSSSGIGMHAVGGGASPGTPPFNITEAAVFAEGGFNTGVLGTSGSGDGVHGFSTSGIGIKGECYGSSAAVGVLGQSGNGTGVGGNSGNGTGVEGVSTNGTGVFGGSASSDGVHGLSSSGLAGLFDGSVQVNGNLSISGALSKSSGSFKIDHPLDPAHKYLYHSFVESPDMKNIYDGVVTLDANGEAEVRLPAWFDTLNTEFRYQLTAIGASAPDLYIAEEINGNRFKIAGGKVDMKVSWLVTGIGQDAWANTYRIPIEEDKPENEQGSYLHPELYGQSEQKSLVHGR